jgi:membrane-associated protein
MLLRDGFLAEHRWRAVARADRFFAHHGAATVFLARWIPGVRVVAAAMAGATRMPWRRFALANALGAVFWAATVATTAAFLGTTGALTVALAGLAVGAMAAAIATLGARRGRRQRGRADSAAGMS